VEQVQEFSDTMLFSTWDIKRAFDSIGKWAIELAAQRAGCTPEHAKWLAEMDLDEQTFVRTPFTMGRSAPQLEVLFQKYPELLFSALRGTPQGDVLSPDVWTMFFDILLTALQMGAEESYAYTDIEGHMHTVKDMAFADDLMSPSRTLPGIQRKANIVSAFCLIFGLQMMPKKLRAFRMDFSALKNRRPEEELIVHLKNWEPHPIPIRTEGHCKYLGVLVDTEFDFKAEFSQLLSRLRRCLTVLGRKMASPDIKRVVLMLYVMSQARYGATLAALTPKQLALLDRPVTAFYRKAYKTRPGFPAALFYMAKSAGGMELPMLSRQILEAKRRIVTRATAPSTVAAMSGMSARAARHTGRSSIPGASWAIMPLDPEDNNWEPWSSSLVSWMHSTNHCLAMRGTKLWDMNCPLLDPHEPSSAARTTKLQVLEKYGLICLGDILHPLGTSFALLHWMEPTSNQELSDLQIIRDIGREALLRTTEGVGSPYGNDRMLAALPVSAFDNLCLGNNRKGGLFFAATKSRKIQPAVWQTSFLSHLRQGQCWFATDPHATNHFRQDLIYEILGTSVVGGEPVRYWCRRWYQSTTRRQAYVVSDDEAGGAVLESQLLPLAAFLLSNGVGLQAILSRDVFALKEVAGLATSQTFRCLRDYGLRQCCPPLPAPVRSVNDIELLNTFLDSVRVLASRGAYALCTDGSADWKRTPSEHLFREPGQYIAGAGLVAVPAPGLPLGDLFPALYIPDLLGATDCAFPLEYIALVLARYTASQVEGCEAICVDCQSVIDLIGHLPAVSPFAALDKIWPDISRPYRILPTHVHSHQDDRTVFDNLSRAAQGNCLADAVAEKRLQYGTLALSVTTVPLQHLLDCIHSTQPEWLRMLVSPDGSCSLYHSLCAQSKLSRGLIAQVYWDHRASTTKSSYAWAKGHSRLAAAAGLVGKRGKTGIAGTVRLIHDKVWWGNRYNPKRGTCKGCVSSLMFPYKEGHPLAELIPEQHKPLVAGDPHWGELVDQALILEGIEHWGSVCVDFKVVSIRQESEKKARAVLDARLRFQRDSFHCASSVLTFMLADPLRFQGRFGTAATVLITQVLNERSSRPTDLYEALTECVHIFMEAGKDIYSLQSPGQELARRRFKDAQTAARKEHAAANAGIKQRKLKEKAERIRVAEANRLAQERAGIFPDGQTSLHAYFLTRPCTPTVSCPAPSGAGDGTSLETGNPDTVLDLAPPTGPLPTAPPLARSCSSFLVDLDSTDDMTTEGTLNLLRADVKSAGPDSPIELPDDLRRGVADFLTRRRALFDIPPEIEAAIRAADLRSLAPRRRAEWETLVHDFVLMVGRGCVHRPQTQWYNELVSGYSSPRILGILSELRSHQTASILQYALDRFARITIAETQSFDISVPLGDPIADTGCTIGGGLGYQGVRWSDVLFHLGFDHDRWWGLSSVVIDHYREVFKGLGFA
jgi:hypothetical protein